MSRHIVVTPKKIDSPQVFQSGVVGPQTRKDLCHIAEIGFSSVIADRHAVLCQGVHLDPIQEYFELGKGVRDDIDAGSQGETPA